MAADSDEKKIKVDELADEVSSFTPVATPLVPRFAPQAKIIDPRIERLKNLDDESRSLEMSRKWRYDKREWQGGWVIYLLLLIMLQSTNLYRFLMLELQLMNSNMMGLGDAFFNLLTMGLDRLLKNPLAFFLLAPFIFKFTRPSLYFVELGFDGISTVKSFTFNEPVPSRLHLGWDEIKSVKKGACKRREILIFEGQNGIIGEMLWDISQHEKKSIKLLLGKFVHEQHPLRQFLAKEIK